MSPSPGRRLPLPRAPRWFTSLWDWQRGLATPRSPHHRAPQGKSRSLTSRMSVVLLVVGLLAIGFLYDRVDIFTGHDRTVAREAVITPAISDPAPLDGAWYCPLGSSSPSGFANNTIHVSNLSEDPAVANVIIYTADSVPVSVKKDLAPLSTLAVQLSSIVQADVAGAVVEIIGGTGVVGHTVQSATGTAEGPCSTQVSSTWYFGSGRTTRDSKQYVALMNPFPEDVRYNVELYRASGRPRKPAGLSGQEVPANSVRVIEIGSYVAREDAIAAAITTDRGRLVVERLQTLDGALGPSGAALQLGVATPAADWMLPAGRIHDGGSDRVVVFNPSEDATSDVSVDLWPLKTEDRSIYGLTSITREIGPGRFEVIDLRVEADRFGLKLPYEAGVSVSATNGVPVVVDRWQFAKQVDTSLIGAGGDQVASPTTTAKAPPAAPGTTAPGAAPTLALPDIFGQDNQQLAQPTANAGVAVSRGTEVLSTRWILPWVSTPSPTATVVVVTSPQGAHVEVRALVNGELQAPFQADVVPDGRAVIPLSVTVPGVPVLVTATAPVSVEAQVVVPDGRLATVAAVPTVNP